MTLEKSCEGRPNCFEDDVVGLSNWIITVRQPDPTNPLVVDVGPGRFVGTFTCYHTGSIALRGAGRTETLLDGGEEDMGIYAAFCDDLEVSDMAVLSQSYAAAVGGKSVTTWTDVDLHGAISSWWDYGCLDDEEGPDGEHYIYGSKLVGGAVGYIGHCAETWIYGSDVETLGNRPPAATGNRFAGIWVKGRGDVRLFGTSLRVFVESMPPEAPPLAVAGGFVEDHGIFHMHGGVIDVNGSNFDEDSVEGLYVERGETGRGFAHVIETSFVMTPPQSGSFTRTSSDGDDPGATRSPYLWPSSTEPPHPGRLVSTRGDDLYVETDCARGGTCRGQGDEPHLMISSDACGRDGGSPWFDVVTGQCR